MNLLIEISVPEIQRIVNETYPEVLYDGEIDEGNEDALILVKVFKREDIRITTVDNNVVVVAPLHIRTEIKRWKFMWGMLKGMNITNIGAREFDITVRYEISLSLDEDWVLTPKTYASFEWDQDAQITIGTVPIKISRLLRPIFKREIINAAKEIDTFIEEEVNFRQQIQEAWKLMQIPLLVDEEMETWQALFPLPSNVFATPIRCMAGKISMMIALETYPEVFIGEQPKTPPLRPLPSFKFVRHLPSYFSLPVVGQMSYKKIKEVFAQQSYDVGDYVEDFFVEDLSFEPGKDKLIINIHAVWKVKVGFFSREIKGIMRVRTTAYRDTQTRTTKVKIIGYDILATDLMIRFADWLNHDMLLKELNRQVDEVLQEQIRETKQLVQTAINEPIHENATLRGQVESLTLEEIYITETGIRVVGLVSGEISVRVILPALPQV